MSGFIEELTSAATMAASALGIRLKVMPVEPGVAVEADRQVLGAVVMNVLQNAFKFTRPRTTVTLRVGASAERVLIEIEDECGGLPAGDVNDLFRPFEQRSANRTGLGLGLAFSRWGVEANHGRLYARNLPERDASLPSISRESEQRPRWRSRSHRMEGEMSKRYIDEKRAEEAKEEALTRRLSCNSFRGCTDPRRELDNLSSRSISFQKTRGSI